MSEKEIQIGGPDLYSDDQVKDPAKAPAKASILDTIINKNHSDFLPWEKVTLPSHGVYYNGKIPNGVVEVKPLGLVADKILATGRLIASGQALDHIYDHHVRLPNDFDPQNLLVGDRTFLLFYLRGITHGNMYEFTMKCSNDDCGKNSMHSYDLNDLQSCVQNPKHDSEPIKVELPHLSKVIGTQVYAEVRFMRGYDLKKIRDNVNLKKRLNGNTVKSRKNDTNEIIKFDDMVEDNLALAITSINGEKDADKISQVVERMSADDTARIRAVVDDDAPGIDLDVTINCPHCGTDMNTTIPLTETFFRPTRSGGM